MEMLKNALARYLKPGREQTRVLLTVFGVLICGVGVAMTRMANFGVDPFQTLCTGLYNKITFLPQGTTYTLINGILLVVVLLLNRHYIGLGTLINMFLLGYVIDGSEQLLLALTGTPGIAGQVIYLILSMFVLNISSAMYITANMGVSTYDAISLHMADKKMGPYRLLRIMTDLICVGAGFAMGAPVGITTIITALCMGPMIALFREKWFEPLLKRMSEKYPEQ